MEEVSEHSPHPTGTRPARGLSPLVCPPRGLLPRRLTEVDRQEPSLCARCAAAIHCQPLHATGCATVVASEPVLASTTLVAARPASGSGRGPHTGCLAPASPQDKTAACAASGQRTPDTRPRHTVGRPRARRPGGDASRPWQ